MAPGPTPGSLTDPGFWLLTASCPGDLWVESLLTGGGGQCPSAPPLRDSGPAHLAWLWLQEEVPCARSPRGEWELRHRLQQGVMGGQCRVAGRLPMTGAWV